jgi:uncharacterized protein (TIGR02118 family)
VVELWTVAQHRSVVSKIPGLTRWVQNRVLSAEGEPLCDGIGELWFDSDPALQEALTSREWRAAVEDAGRFLDLTRSGLIIVEEMPVPDLAPA